MGHGFYDFDYFGSIQISSGKRASHGLKQGVHPPIGLGQWHVRIQVTIIEFSRTIEIINHKVSSIGVLTFTIAIKSPKTNLEGLHLRFDTLFFSGS